MTCLRIFIVIWLIPVAIQAQHKIGLELKKPLKPFTMRVGDPIDIEFEAVTSYGQYYYVVYLKHADDPPWHSGEGPLTLELQPLKQGLNRFKWDGQSLGGAPTDVPEIVKLREGHPHKYYFMIYIFDSNKDVALVGMMINYNKKVITQLRSKNFTVN